jgi:hypothetical protein
MMKVEFQAQIKRLQMVIDACGDKGGKVDLVFRDEEKTFEALNRLMKSDSEIRVLISDEKII